MIRRAGLYAIGMITCVVVGAGGARLLWPGGGVSDAQDQLDEGGAVYDPSTEPLPDDAVNSDAVNSEADVALEDQAAIS